MKRIWMLTIGLLVFFSVSFMVAEQAGWLTADATDAWLREAMQTRAGLSLAVLIIAGLLVGDIILPVPSSVVMLGAGRILGTGVGTLVTFAAAMLAALIGYGICYWLQDHGITRRLLPKDEKKAVQGWFERWGVLALIMSRPIPMLTEILSCLAGYSRFSFLQFIGAVAVGTLPTCLLYAWAGSQGKGELSWLAMGIALGIPTLGWFITRHVKREPSEDQS